MARYLQGLGGGGALGSPPRHASWAGHLGPAGWLGGRLGQTRWPRQAAAGPGHLGPGQWSPSAGRALRRGGLGGSLQPHLDNHTLAPLVRGPLGPGDRTLGLRQGVNLVLLVHLYGAPCL